MKTILSDFNSDYQKYSLKYTRKYQKILKLDFYNVI